MAADPHEDFIIPCPNPHAVTSALDAARKILRECNREIRRGVLAVPEDPRLPLRPVQAKYVDFFKVDRGLASMRQVAQIGENYGRLEQAAKHVTTICVSDKDPEAKDGSLLRDAFADQSQLGPPVVFLCPPFFQEKKGDREPADRRRGAIIIHELAHAVLGAGHGGGNYLDFDGEDSPLKTFAEAIDNAYVYDGFALWVTGRQPGR